MKKSLLIFLMGVFSVFTASAQQTIVKGSVKDASSQEPLPGVLVTIEGTNIFVETDANGAFVFTQALPLGEQVLSLTKDGYIPNRYPIVVNEGQIVDITDMILEVNINDAVDLSVITLSDEELDDDVGGADNISGLLQSSQDVFQRTAAFEFSSSFFRIRGLDSENSTMMINGIEMNKTYDGRPQWSDWGGLNDVLRNQELSTGWSPSEYTFGGALGAVNINVRASKYRAGGRITYSSSNRSYTNRLMASYASGLLQNGWAYTLMVSRRWGNEGFQDATFYDANSFFASVEKVINEKHSLNFTSIYSPNRRGKSSPNTQEVYDLKDIKYNEYWGWQDGEKRNSRIKRIEEPILMLNHYWNISNSTSLNTNVAYQFGELGNSRLDYPGGGNPSPAYYQGLPSYALGDPDGPDYEQAYLNYQNFTEGGQIDWNRIYDANLTNNIAGDPAAYVLYEDRNDDKQLTINSILNTEINENIMLNASINYKKLKSENFGEIIDMLGSTVGYLNVDSFDGYQYDLQNPDALVGEGDKIRYNYNMYSDVISGFAQAQFKYNKVDFYLAGSLTSTSYQREGIFQHELYQDSYGKSDKLTFTGVGAKAGFTYKISGKHLIDVNGGYVTKAPSLRNTYSNARENDAVVKGITEEKLTSFDASYIFRSPILNARLTGYYAKIQDANEISFYYADGVGSFVVTADEGGEDFNDTSAFVQEVLHGIDKKHIGVELGLEAQVTPTIKLKGVASIGQYTYDNNPGLYLTSSDFRGTSTEFTSNLKDYKIAGGPQQAYSFGFEYRDPDYWWFGATANWLANTYVDVSPLTRTENFYLDADGLPFNDYDPEVARELLKQEKFDDYLVVNLVGGKSWKIGDYYIGFFASVNNLLDEVYKTGGFEQGRNANYRELRDDFNNPKRVFGPKYWYGRGTNYFVNVYFRF
ncbi:MAG: carboxypeptidase regulatory-like domain-containing protein [Flavobacteriaceae bacterium]|nr:carboxypeptidase regulatory-like domain-containing protein [Mangrovimonas sp.]MCB0434502.1 carboxypeptidase regulatory-like domain-containing protein [Mangrovimonas sp.]MCB0438020.1 carboxypeptidase regulatory-like domain-containing protein [Mangrovimonas sp.]HRV54483.1 carboxypeptidase regulatory-like domain-containing protein [Mangrovimonas sp.]